MRRVPVVTLASLVAVVGLMAAPVYGATLFANDTPDIKLGVGEAGDDVFDLNDFFDTTAEGSISYTAGSGGSVADGMASVEGSADPGMSTVEFTGDDGSESLTVDSVVQVSSFLIQNGPAIDNNNRLAGVAPGNAYINGIVPGSSVGSAVALTPSSGGTLGEVGATDGGTTGAGTAGLIATIGEVSTSYAETGLVQRSSEVLASGAGSASYEGLTATVNADGSYSLETTDAFAGTYVVTLGASDGTSTDAVHLLATSATELDLVEGGFIASPAADFPLAEVSYSDGSIVVEADPGEGVLLISNVGVTAAEYATVSANFNASANTAAVATVGFDADGPGSLGNNKYSYSIVTGANVEAGVVKANATTVKATSGFVLPAVQVFNTGEEGSGLLTVTISQISVMDASELTMYALNPNATADLSSVSGGGAIDGSIPSVDGWLDDPNAIGTAPSAFNSDNHWAVAGTSGSIQLDGTGENPSTSAIQSAPDAGTIVAECWVKTVSADEAGSVFNFVFTDGSSESMTWANPTDMATDSWEKVIVTANQADESARFVVLQAVNANILVDDVSVRLVADSDAYFDYSLLGM